MLHVEFQNGKSLFIVYIKIMEFFQGCLCNLEYINFGFNALEKCTICLDNCIVIQIGYLRSNKHCQR